jgi:serine/threonine protein kinase
MCGDWRVLDRIGGGGNGDVYRCKGQDGAEAAIKVLKRGRDRRHDRMPRFRNEIRFLESRRNYPGVLPMLDHLLPNDPAEPSWYVMPIATPLLEVLGEAPEFPGVVDAIGHIADTLARLAAEGVADPDLGRGHRDIRPENLFQLNGEWVIGDFGLVKYPALPEEERITRQGRPLGPYDFMAPEMRRDADTARPEPADVYSLAKTLWSVATGERYPPPGELRSDRPERLSAHLDDQRATLLEPLLERCTLHDPAARPAMREVAEELAYWSMPPAVPVEADLSGYSTEVDRLRKVAMATRDETEIERLMGLFSDAEMHVHSDLLRPLIADLEGTGLRNFGSPPRDMDDGALPRRYASSISQFCLGVETYASPCLAVRGGVFLRRNDFRDIIGVIVTIAMLTADSQHTYLELVEHFNPGSFHLSQIIEQFRAQINTELPEIISQFLTAYREIGVPRR